MSLDWLDDIRLLLLYSPYSPPEANGTRLELWRFDVEASNSLGLDEGVTLAPNVAVRGAGAVHLEDGRFAYGLVHESDPAMAGLYIQTSLTTAAVRVNGLPVGLFEPTVIWSPDGRGAMISGTGEGYYAESEGVLADVSGCWGKMWERWFGCGRRMRCGSGPKIDCRSGFNHYHICINDE